ncbi:MAG TPA: hypothetical protein VHO46_12340 [Bacteroidales bacterium]|nr:hypothetical protein [Bacteroidales bacterium]
MKVLTRFFLILVPVCIMISSCEGPSGPAGKSADESCIICHNRDVVDAVRTQYEHSRHYYGEAFEEGTRNVCAPCHSTRGFLYVVENAVPANNYVTDAATASLPGRLECLTCHSKIHTTYTMDDFELTTTAAVPMLMWAGSKTLDFPVKESNLCAKCHQPRQVAGQGGVINYAGLVSDPNTPFTMAAINYRTGVHYGTESAMVGGEGGIEFGGITSRDHPHGTNASCSTCHMAAPSAMSGGHSFIPNFNGCNGTGCHTDMSATNAGYVALRTQFSQLITTLGNSLNAIGGGHDILQRDPTDNQWHGYVDIYDAAANTTAFFGAPGNPVFPALTNEQFGALINFQLLVRDGSMGIHNPNYMMQLLQNTITALAQ